MLVPSPCERGCRLVPSVPPDERRQRAETHRVDGSVLPAGTLVSLDFFVERALSGQVAFPSRRPRARRPFLFLPEADGLGMRFAVGAGPDLSDGLQVPGQQLYLRDRGDFLLDAVGPKLSSRHCVGRNEDCGFVGEWGVD